ncbi:MAG: ABC transporter permease [Acidobacteriota bacterium]
MTGWSQDLRFAARQLKNNPAFTAVAVLALALGIGSNTLIFSVVDAVLLRPLDFPQPQRLVTLWEVNTERGLDRQQLSPVNYSDYRQMQQVFEDLAGWWYPDINLSDESGEPIRVKTIAVTDNFFSVLRVQPILGRSFEAGEDRRGQPLIAVIGHALWRSRYGGDENILDRTVRLDSREYSVIGVAPPGFDFPNQTQVWQPLGWDPTQHSRGAHFFEVVGRLQPGLEIDQAQAELSALTERWQTEFPNTNKGWTTRAVLLHDELVGQVRPALLLLLGAVGLVLLIACANVANLLLARTSARQREVAVRTAMGAGRWRIARQFLTESTVLSGLGGLLGLGLAFAGLRLAVAFNPIQVPRLETAALDWRVLAFTFLAALLTGLLFGTAPAVQMTRRDLVQSINEGGRGSSDGRHGERLRNLLVVAEVALALMLLVAAGLLGRSFLQLMQEDPGFQTRQLVTANINLPRSGYQDWAQVGSFFTRLLDETGAQPQVRSVGATGFLPFEAGWRIPFSVEGRTDGRSEDRPQAQYVTVTPGYFRSMGIPLLQGRLFEGQDDETRPGVVVINQAMARRHWPQGDDPIHDVFISATTGIGPLGRCLIQDRRFEIVGVVGNVKNNSLQTDAEPAVYFVHKQFPYRSMNLVLEGEGSPAALASLIRQQVRRLDADLPISDIRTLEQIVSQTVAQPRFLTLLLTGFSALAMLMSALGIYGVLSYSVSRRSHEIGIRMALGARRGDVVSMVVRQGMWLAVGGVALGAVGALLLSSGLSSMLFGVQPTDPLTYLGVSLLVLAVGLLACYLPARRASSVDPLVALRRE